MFIYILCLWFILDSSSSVSSVHWRNVYKIEINLCICVCACIIPANVRLIGRSERFGKCAKMQNNPSPQLPCKGILKTSRSFDKSGARWAHIQLWPFDLKQKANKRFYYPLQLSQKCQVRWAECAANVSSGRQGLWPYENRWAKDALQLHGAVQWE